MFRLDAAAVPRPMPTAAPMAVDVAENFSFSPLSVSLTRSRATRLKTS
jgi:hypothetical protein